MANHATGGPAKRAHEVMRALLAATLLLGFAAPTGGASPPLPGPDLYSTQLVLDDDGAEGVFGFAGSTARQFLWFNEFENSGRFLLEEIWVLFPSGMDVPLGGDIELVVYHDPDNNPANGAVLLARVNQNIQSVTGHTFSVYPLANPIEITDAGGSLLVGVINRYFETGVDPPPTLPAALDTTASQDHSWFALWAGDAPKPPDLASATEIDVLDGLVSGNWMIRAFGTTGDCLSGLLPDLHLVGSILSGSQLIRACDSITLENVDIGASASVVLRAGDRIILDEGTSVDSSSSVSMEIYPVLKMD